MNNTRPPLPHHGSAENAMTAFTALSATALVATMSIACDKTAPTNDVAVARVDVDRTTVALGEDIAVTVAATGTSGSDRNLVVTINGRIGSPQILRYNTPGEKTVSVSVKDPLRPGQMATKQVTVHVVDEPATQQLTVVAHPSDDTTGVYELEVVEAAQLSQDALYLWRFGDADFALTRSGFTTHDYRHAVKPDAMTTSFVVHVTSLMTGQGVMNGRASLSIANFSYWSSRIGTPTVPVYHDRFASLEDGTLVAPLTFRNIYESDVTFTSAKISWTSCSPNDSAPSASLPPQPASVVLDNVVVSAGAETASRFALERNAIAASACALSATFTGFFEGDDETVVSAKLSLDLPPTVETPGAEDLPVVVNQHFLEKLNHAENLLGPGVPITPSILRSLEKQGKL